MFQVRTFGFGLWFPTYLMVSVTRYAIADGPAVQHVQIACMPNPTNVGFRTQLRRLRLGLSHWPGQTTAAISWLVGRIGHQKNDRGPQCVSAEQYVAARPRFESFAFLGIQTNEMCCVAHGETQPAPVRQAVSIAPAL